jgi:hypothetical protein
LTARQLIVPGAMPSRDTNGRALPAKFRFYQPGTTIPGTVYTDDTLATPHAFPIVSDGAGRWPTIWADDTHSFDVGWTDQTFDQTIGTFAGVSPADDAVLASVALSEAAKEAAELAQAQAEAAAARAEDSANGIDTRASSSTSLTIGAGSKVITLSQSGKSFAVGMDVTAADLVTPANRMVGEVTAFADPVLTVNVTSFTGSGTHALWEISQAPPGAVSAVAGLSGTVDASALKAALSLDAVDNTHVVGRHAIWVPAASMGPRITNGAASASIETGTNKVMLRTLNFDASTIEYAQFAIRMPKSWDEGSVTFVPEWSHSATATNFKVSWGLQALALSDGDAIDAAFGTAQYSNDTGGTADVAYAGPESASVTIAGSPAAEDLVIFQVLRKADDAVNDTLAVDGRLHGVTIYVLTATGNDA